MVQSSDARWRIRGFPKSTRRMPPLHLRAADEFQCIQGRANLERPRVPLPCCYIWTLSGMVTLMAAGLRSLTLGAPNSRSVPSGSMDSAKRRSAVKDFFGMGLCNAVRNRAAHANPADG